MALNENWEGTRAGTVQIWLQHTSVDQHLTAFLPDPISSSCEVVAKNHDAQTRFRGHGYDRGIQCRLSGRAPSLAER